MLCLQFNYKLHCKQSLALKIITFSSTRRWHLEMIKWKFLSLAGGVARVVMRAIVSPGYVSLYSDPGMQAPAEHHVCSALWDILSGYQQPLVCPVCSDLWPVGGCSRHPAAWDSMCEMCVSLLNAKILEDWINFQPTSNTLPALLRLSWNLKVGVSNFLCLGRELLIDGELIMGLSFLSIRCLLAK